MKTPHRDREIWLMRAIRELQRFVFRPCGYTVPRVRVSVGFSGSKSKHAIGACWHPNASNDKTSQIFISPTIEDSQRILDILAHEIIHAIVPEAGHRKAFKHIATSIGLEGKMTATIAGEKIIPRLKAIIELLGECPHSKLNIETRAIGKRKKQAARLLKITCPRCGYTARVARKWLEIGMPTCPCGESFNQRR